MADEETKDKRAQYAYLDLLATTLTEHEKNLDRLVDRLEKISKDIARLGQSIELEEQAKPAEGIVKKAEPETLTYIKMKLNRPTTELKEILGCLKE